MSTCEQGNSADNQVGPADPWGCWIGDGLMLDVLDSWNTGR